MIISKDLEALLLTAKSAAVMRKTLFNKRQFFLQMRVKRLRTKVIKHCYEQHVKHQTCVHPLLKIVPYTTKAPRWFRVQNLCLH